MKTCLTFWPIRRSLVWPRFFVSLHVTTCYWPWGWYDAYNNFKQITEDVVTSWPEKPVDSNFLHTMGLNMCLTCVWYDARVQVTFIPHYTLFANNFWTLPLRLWELWGSGNHVLMLKSEGLCIKALTVQILQPDKWNLVNSILQCNHMYFHYLLHKYIRTKTRSRSAWLWTYLFKVMWRGDKVLYSCIPVLEPVVSLPPPSVVSVLPSLTEVFDGFLPAWL